MIDNEQQVWIKTEPTLDGTAYVVTIEASDDIAVTLDRDRALAYAYELLRAVAFAEYDAAVLAQLSDKGLREAAGKVVLDLRKDRPPLDAAATDPFVFEPGVSHRDRRGFLRILLGGKPLGQWTLPDARTHALTILEAHVVADLDAAYYRNLHGSIGLDDDTARAIINNLSDYR